MKYVLDMKDYCQKAPHSEEKNYNERFYRYLIQDESNITYACVWFAQMVDSGNIYTVSVAIRDEALRDYFDIYIKNDNKDRGYYPEYFEISLSSARIQERDYRRYQEVIAIAYSIASTVMEIFKDEEGNEFTTQVTYNVFDEEG